LIRFGLIPLGLNFPAFENDSHLISSELTFSMPQEQYGGHEGGQQQPLTCQGPESNGGDESITIRISNATYASGIFVEEYGTPKYWDAVAKAVLHRERARITTAKECAEAALKTHLLR
jgi:hypothetical protein